MRNKTKNWFGQYISTEGNDDQKDNCMKDKAVKSRPDCSSHKAGDEMLFIVSWYRNIAADGTKELVPLIAYLFFKNNGNRVREGANAYERIWKTKTNNEKRIYLVRDQTKRTTKWDKNQEGKYPCWNRYSGKQDLVIPVLESNVEEGNAGGKPRWTCGEGMSNHFRVTFSRFFLTVPPREFMKRLETSTLEGRLPIFSSMLFVSFTR